MSVLIAFILYGVKSIEIWVGANATPYVVFVLLGVLLIAVGIFNDRFRARVTVPVGVAGWAIVLIMLLVHYSNQ